MVFLRCAAARAVLESSRQLVPAPEYSLDMARRAEKRMGTVVRLDDASARAEESAPLVRARAIALRVWHAVAVRIDLAAIGLGAVTLVALILRLYDINWDDNTHLHPDERAITLVAQCLGLQSVQPGCTPVPDPANPHFFAYGSFPIYLLALVAHGLAHVFANWHGLPADGGTFDDYNHFTLVGRALSALFDTGTVLVTGLIVRRLVGRWWGVFAAAFVAVIAFEVQVSHFYAVDTVLTFFTTLAIFGALGLAGMRRADGADPLALEPDGLPRLRVTLAWAALTGLAAGLALASKVSAAPLALPIGLALIIRWRRLGWSGWQNVAVAATATVLVAILSFVVTSPYAILDSKEFWNDVNLQDALAHGTIIYPYTIQFANTVPYLYQLKNIFIWNLGPTLTLAGIAGAVYAIVRVLRRWDDIVLVPLSWVLISFGITGDFYMKFPRYQLPIFPILAVLAAIALAALARSAGRLPAWPVFKQIAAWRPDWPRWLAGGLVTLTLLGGALWTLMFLQIYTQPVTRITASQWIYAHVPAGSTITYEIWDDALPLQVGQNSPYIYHIIGLDLYAADSAQKAQTLAGQIASADVIVLSSARLIGSITEVPQMYPLTVHYYQLLFNGQLGFTLAHAPFSNEPHWGPFRLSDAGPDDTGADESLSVYDHPTVWIFTRSGPALSAATIQSRLLAGVSLPQQQTSPANQPSLLLTQQQTTADNASPPLWQAFDPQGLATKLALPLWWLAIEALGLLVFPLVFLALPALRDRGWGLTKAVGVLALSYVVWLPASVGIWPYERATVWVTFGILAVAGGAVAWWKRDALRAFFRERWRLIAITEAITLVAFLAFAAIRAADPDLWHIYRGGEKPMEIAFLDGILRSRTLPPLDPWFAGGYINYYYFGQFLVATLIQLTGITPTTAFNLAIPMLFALTIAGAISVVGSVAGRLWAGVLGGWFLAVAGNLNGMQQYWSQLTAAWQGKVAPAFDYWASSRIINGTINEFPFWSFLYADLHAHVIDLPIITIGLGAAASLIMTPATEERRLPWGTLLLAALAVGAMACINTWDAPTYGLVIVIALLLAEWRRLSTVAQAAGRGWQAWLDQIRWSLVRRVTLSLVILVGGAFLLYAPFYLHFQALFSKIGPVPAPDDPLLFLVIFGLWLFIAASWFLVEIHRWWEDALAERHGGVMGSSVQRLLALLFIAVIVLTLAILDGLRSLLIVLILAGLVLAWRRRHDPMRLFTYLLILAGLCVALAVEFVYLRDFLDNSLYERMNTVFKFFYQVWLLLALGAALALADIFRGLFTVAPAEEVPDWPLADVPGVLTAVPSGPDPAQAPAWWQRIAHQIEGDALVDWGLRMTWIAVLVVLLAGSSVFMIEGTQARVADHSAWVQIQPPPGPLNSLPSLDGFAYMYAWYPGDAAAISWINYHLGGDPVIVEAGTTDYGWDGRVSIYTGLPTVLGWASHESQQRYGDEVYTRQNDVGEIFNSGDPSVVLPLLHRYNVRYVYVGQLECFEYGVHDPPYPAGSGPSAADLQTCTAANDLVGSLKVFPQMVGQGTLKVVYQQQGVTIFEVIN
jgi:YYY domain-containing protein